MRTLMELQYELTWWSPDSYQALTLKSHLEALELIEKLRTRINDLEAQLPKNLPKPKFRVGQCVMYGGTPRVIKEMAQYYEHWTYSFRDSILWANERHIRALEPKEYLSEWPERT